MKNNGFIIAFALILSFAAFFSSCRKNPENYISPTAVSVNDLNIPPSFDWKLTKTINLTFASSTPTLIEVHDQNKQAYYYKGMHNGREALSATISIPTYQNSFFVNGTSYSVSATNQTINLDMQQKAISSSENFTIGSENFLFANNAGYGAYAQTSVKVLSPECILVSFWRDNPLIETFVALLKIEGNTITKLDSIKIASEECFFHSFSQLENGQILFSYTSNSYETRAKITPIFINGLQLSKGEEYVFSSPDAPGPCLFPLQNDIFLAHYNSNSEQHSGRIKLMKFDGIHFTNISDSIDYAINVHEMIPGIVQLANGNILLVNRQQHEIYGMTNLWSVFAINGTNITQVSSYQFPESQGNLTGIIQMGDKIVTSGFSDNGLMHLVEVSGNNISYLSQNQIITPNGGYSTSAAINETSFFTTYFTFENTGDQYLSLCDITGNQITKRESVRLNYHSAQGVNLIRHLDGDRFIIIAPNKENNIGNIYGYIVTVNSTPTGDTDADGVPDDADDYPNDPSRAFDIYFPAYGYGSLAFEDLWPGKGDYDFNDMVIDYRFKTVINALNEVVEMTATFPVKAAGAAYVNGFGFSLRNTPSTITNNMTIVGNELSESLVSLSDKGWEANQSIPTTIVFDNIFSLLPHPGIGIGVNTELNAPFVDYDTIRLSFTPSEAISYTQLSIASWNPFVLVNKDRSHEVHLPYYEPTALFDLSLFGQWEDNSAPAQDRYFLTANNLPWGIDIPSSFVWPTEKTEITEAYSKFAAWAESGGALYNDWFLNQNGNVDESKVYLRND